MTSDAMYDARDAREDPAPALGVAIFTARESVDVLAACLRATIGACVGLDARVDVLVNGNLPLAQDIASVTDRERSPVRVRVWHIPLGDKANAWNVYLHHI